MNYKNFIGYFIGLVVGLIVAFLIAQNNNPKDSIAKCQRMGGVIYFDKNEINETKDKKSKVLGDYIYAGCYIKAK